MRKLLSKKSAAVAAILAVAVTATAFAYLTVGGAGTGTGSASAQTASLVLSVDGPAFSRLDQAQTVDVYAANPGDNPQVLSTLAVDVDEAAGSGCPDGSFTLESKTANRAEVPAGAGSGDKPKVKVGTATIRFNNVDADQAPCLTGSALTIGLNKAAN